MTESTTQLSDDLRHLGRQVRGRKPDGEQIYRHLKIAADCIDAQRVGLDGLAAGLSDLAAAIGLVVNAIEATLKITATVPDFAIPMVRKAAAASEPAEAPAPPTDPLDIPSFLDRRSETEGKTP